MSLTLTEEQHELSRTVADFLDKQSPEAEVRRLMEGGGATDPHVWSQMAQQLGLQGLIIPEAFGGGGFGFTELVVVLERMGASLLVAPFLSTAVAGAALLLSPDATLKSEYLPALGSGARVGTLALAEDTGRWDVDSVHATARAAGEGFAVTGAKAYVVDGQHADFFIVSARSRDGVGLFVVDADSSHVSVTPSKALDATRPLARLEFDGAPARPLSEPADDGAALRRLLDMAAVALGAEQVGGAQRCLDMAVGYAKVRVQFGRPIGSFQAIKHKCADVLLAVESARSAVYYAAGVLDDGGEDLSVSSALAQAQCSTAYTHAAAENIQIHGGIGFTWEHPAHLYFKRAKSSELLFGAPATHRERLAQLVGI
jgi:alkylation response protein AidB-like acyl-CoA dehydrogenase